MQRLQNFISNFVFFLLVLLGFLLIFESYVEVPFWLQPIGRMHPMLLHFPIALIVVMVLLDAFKSHLDHTSYQKVHAAALYLTVFTTALSAIMGFLLSKEEGYTSELMSLHKWVGVSVTYLIYILLLIDPQKLSYRILLYGSFIILFFAGHFGAGLTHGMDFLMEPIAAMSEPEITQETPIFQAFIDPILEEKCKGCHNPQKHKGDLDMSTYDLLLEGGEHGPVLIKGNSMESELIHRALLPMAMEEHMPPEGKPQLTDFELELLTAWIDSGADPEINIAGLNPEDTLFSLATYQMNLYNEKDTGPKYDFDFAEEKLIASLNNPYRSVVQQTPGSPALDVSIFVKQAYKDQYLKELTDIKNQLVSLNLSYMPVTDDDLVTIGKFQNLEILNLNNTNITNEGLQHLTGCINLTLLSLSGTKIELGIEEWLANLESLESVYLWNTRITDQQLDELKKQLPDIDFYLGYAADQEPPIQLTSPLLKNKSTVLMPGEEVILEHKLSGVTIRYTTDGTDPDSISSDLYQGPFKVQGYTRVKAFAFKDQWLTSDTIEYKVFTPGLTPKEIELQHPPDKEYPGRGTASLTDLEKGKASNFKGKEWLGFHGTPFEAIFDFGTEPAELSQLVFCYLVNTGSQIMSPLSVEILGGNDKQQMQLLSRKKLPEDHKNSPNEATAVVLEFEPSKYRYYQVKGRPVGKLPSWHNAKGKPGWLFVDELFFY
ncbi:MAG: hypothetical protein DHS20C17_25170 [Cyclobacteriaceae bacterium]|nr:MAG: hypothetical protein DHS20C17_25170 [Cyclobacteriaceae bacterium]